MPIFSRLYRLKVAIAPHKQRAADVRQVKRAARLKTTFRSMPTCASTPMTGKGSNGCVLSRWCRYLLPKTVQLVTPWLRQQLLKHRPVV